MFIIKRRGTAETAISGMTEIINSITNHSCYSLAKRSIQREVNKESNVLSINS